MMESLDSALPPRAVARTQIFSLLGPDGRFDETQAPALPDEALLGLHEAMVSSRLVDARMAKLAAERRIAMHVPAAGLEAAVVGATRAFRDQDWIFPTARDLGAFIARGVGLEQIAAQAFGTGSDRAKGRQLPGHLTARAQRLASVGSPHGAHLMHASGCAWGARIAGEPLVVGAFFDASLADAADFHCALNFAGVLRAPVVFVCYERGESAGPVVADRGVAYGVGGVRADGRDVLAVNAVVAEAVQRAANGNGPTLVELVVGPPSEGEVPSHRLRAHIEQRGLWSADQDDALLRRVGEQIDVAFSRAERAAAPAVEGHFDDVYADLPWHLREQREQARSR